MPCKVGIVCRGEGRAVLLSLANILKRFVLQTHVLYLHLVLPLRQG